VRREKPNLTVTQIRSAYNALAARAVGQEAGDGTCDCGTDGGDRVGDLTFRSDRGIRGVDNRREGEVCRREGRDVVLRRQAIEAVEFLWASLALFDDDTAADTTDVYRARPFELYQVAEARERILRLLAEVPEGAPLERLALEFGGISEREMWAKLRLRSAWSSTFIAGLELAKQGDMVLGQGEDFQVIHVAPA
jgi:hypothetical protein